jgi:hypothetical protein
VSPDRLHYELEERMDEALEKVTPMAVGELYHRIAAMADAQRELVMHHTLAEVYEKHGAPALAADQRGKQELAEIDVHLTYVAVREWIERHLPEPECPSGECSHG